MHVALGTLSGLTTTTRALGRSGCMNKTQAIEHIKTGRKYAALAPVLREGGVHLGVCTGRGLSTARGTAEAEASEMPIYLGTR